MVAHAYDPSTLETGTGGSQRVWAQPGLHGEHQGILDYSGECCIKKNENPNS